ncbi:hypothetical protein [Bacillus testis]|uniref:hypothetical protein n=1 Tax=Bacillus testis TaxID=1622072 RepID=UPI00067F474F|nr:hypothetical protein [Bacillus testis]
MKKGFIGLLLIAVVAALGFGGYIAYSAVLKSSVSIEPAKGKTIQVSIDDQKLALTLEGKKTSKHIRSEDIQYTYQVKKWVKPVGKLVLTVRKLDNNDFFVFTKIINNSSIEYTAKVTMPFAGVKNSKLQRIDSYGKVKQEANDTFGVDVITHPVGLLQMGMKDGSQKSVMLGKDYLSKEKVQTYANKQKSVLREFQEEYTGVKILQKKASDPLQVNMVMKSKPGAISENWFLVSDKPLFAKQKNIDSWFKKTIREYSSINSWYTAEGPYTKLPWSVEPGYKLGYGRNLGRVHGGVYLKEYHESKERYFYDLSINAIADLDVFSNGDLTKGKVPVFKTEYTSTWLKGAYGVTAPYIDTRHNENIALFLKDAGDQLGIKELKQANEIYADFLTGQKKIGNIIDFGKDGYLIADYYAQGSKKTHVSLNHALGELRFLLEAYESTGKAAYLETAESMQSAIESLYPKWVKPDGDLWYQINGKHVFNGDDYPWLTLVDLLRTQKQLEKLGMDRSDIFDKLIETKTDHIVKNGKPIRQMAVDLLKEQGFGELVEGYGNIVL